jgi:hypothetical protein
MAGETYKVSKDISLLHQRSLVTISHLAPVYCVPSDIGMFILSGQAQLLTQLTLNSVPL